uniref:Cytochrome P450 CYP749A22-like isoform X1 n=1 Tax=Nicotiana tabacum TaxID=4097 RepID=A0A1S3Z7T2_TOBAC|nr:PREDICTED: cytochrome P450 CYP749A22-like isoform X1 [Nicotiana tabacum]
MIIIIASFLFISLLILLFWILKKLWSPIRVQFLMRSQGIQGPTYKFLHGNTKEIVEMRKDSITKSMNHLSHDIFPRILPHVFSWKNVYGANFLYCYGLQPELVVTEPQLLKEILSNRNNNFPKIDLEGFSKKLLGDGVSSSKGEKWTKMRILANHVFHGESLKSMVPMMIMSCETMLEKWKMHEEKEIEVFEEFRILTSEIISRTAFGSSYLEGKNIFQMLMKLALLVSRNAHKIRFPGIKMNMIIEESLRLYPPVPFIKRKVNKKVQLGKLTLPPQMQLYISPLAVQHDPKIWGEDVHIFKPERFAEGVVKATNNNPVAFLPFGYGPRTCLGLNFAMIESKVTLSMILQRYMFTVSPSYVHSPVQLFMLRPQHGVKIILHKI